MSEARIERIDHVNLCTSAERLELVGRFYVEAIGLAIGPRPGPAATGLWLYCGDRPVVHLSAKAPSAGASPQTAREGHVAGFDHVAFRASGGAAYRARLRSLGVPFAESKRPANYQILLADPDGTRLELNFDPAEAG
jgi:hypothetical protein